MDGMYNDIMQEIRNLGFQEVDDRGMAENGGFLFKKSTTDQEIRYWTIHPRMNVSHAGKILFDSGITTNEEILKTLKLLVNSQIKVFDMLY